MTLSLTDEAAWLHRCLFHRPIDDISLKRYEEAHSRFPQVVTTALVSRVVARRLDAEAIEFVLRRRGAGRELTQKIQILSYVAEARPEYLSTFINTSPSRARAAAALLAALLVAVWKSLKGRYLIRRHGLV
jgi:hypothetical protein